MGFILVILLSFGIIIFALPKKNLAGSYLSEYSHKEALLDSVSSPRVIFISGSSIAFGLNSGMIKDSLDVNVINYGLNAGIGLKFMIEDVEEYLKEGDIVVLVPEFGQFYGKFNGSDELLALMEITDWRKIDKVNYSQLRKILKSMGQYSFSKLSKSFATGKAEKPVGIRKDFDRFPYWDYRVEGFNEFGDEESHWYYELHTNVPSPTSLGGEIDYAAIDFLKNKIREWSNDYKVVFIPSATTDSYFQLNKDRILSLSEEFTKSGIPYDGNVTDAVFPDSMAFDLPSHFNATGVNLNTQRIINILKEKL